VSCGNRARLRIMFRTCSEARKSLNVTKISQRNQCTLFIYSTSFYFVIFSLHRWMMSKRQSKNKCLLLENFISLLLCCTKRVHSSLYYWSSTLSTPIYGVLAQTVDAGTPLLHILYTARNCKNVIIRLRSLTRQ